jgi:charged multivesicular body protein 2A
MSFLFGGTPPTTAELARRYKTIINRSMREIDREMIVIQSQERVSMNEIRKFAPTNPAISRQKAQSVVSCRKTLTRYAMMKSQMQEISSRITGVKSAEALENALKSANRAMTAFHTRIGSQNMCGVINDFQRQTTRMSQQTEMADDMLDDAFKDSDEDEEETDDVVESVFREAGVKLPGPPLPRSIQRESNQQQQQHIADTDVLDLEARLQRLRQ